MEQKVELPRGLAWAAWVLAAPLLVTFGLGTSHPILELAAAPASWLFAVPARSGFWGLSAVLVLAALAARPAAPAWLVRSAALVAAWSAFAALAPALATARPLAWVALLAAGFLPDRERPGAAAAAPETSRVAWWLSPSLWFLAMRQRPWGPGLLPEALDDAIAVAVSALPPWAAELPLLLALAGIAALGLRRSAKRAPWARLALGAAAAAALEAGFSTAEGLLSAAALGALAVAWPLAAPLRSAFREPARLAVPLLLLCALAGTRTALLARWHCGRVDGEPNVRFWSKDKDFRDLALVPGNLPYLVARRDDGRELLRLAPTGAISARATLSEPGGVLGSPPGATAGTPFVRVLPGMEQVEWWDAATMERTRVEAFDPLGRAGLGIDPPADPSFRPLGPAGHVEIRDPVAPHRRRDSQRVGIWPDFAAFSSQQEAVYVASSLDGRVFLMDPVVPWQQVLARTGAPARRLLVDGPSGTLYGANRCGVFELRIRSTFPWESSGDVEPATP